VRYALVVDDDRQTLGGLALQLTRLGVLVLYTPDEEEAMLLAAQERGRVRALIVPPTISADSARRLREKIEADIDEGSPSLIIVGNEPSTGMCRALRQAGGIWALWNPIDENDLRFVVHAAMALPWEIARRREARAPVQLPVWLHGDETRALGQVISLSAGGGFIELSEPFPVGTHLELELALEDRAVEVEARVIYVNMRNAEWTLSFPRGVGVVFDKLDDEAETVVRALVSERLAHCTL
jgi:Tfp pilus assembly protein PilZ